MGTLSNSARYIIAVNELLLEIRSYKIKLKDYKKERDNLVEMSAPKDVKAMCYDQPRVQGSNKVIDDTWSLIRIGILSTLINNITMIIDDKEAALRKLRNAGNRVADKLQPDLRKKIFILAWIDYIGKYKNNKELLSILEANGIYISMGTLTNEKTEINKILDESSISV